MGVLYWIYAGRLVISLVIYGLAVLVGDFLASLAPGPIATQVRAIGIIGITAAALITPLAYWYSHRRVRQISRSFLYSQALLDVVLANGIVHVTGGSQSPFVSLFIGLAAAYALVLPLPSAVLVALATGALYLLDNLVAFPDQVSTLALLLQVAVFTLVALVTSLVGARLRDVRKELRTVEGELRRLRLDTADILRIIPSGVLTLDSEGRLAYMNLAAAELLDLEVTELLGRGIVSRLETRAPGVAAAIQETLGTGRRIRDREAELLPPELADPIDGDSLYELRPGVPVAVSTTVVQEAGAGPSHVVLLQDLRASRQLEDLRLRTGRLEAVAELSASLAHELKNPMASVRSAVEQLCERAREDEDDAVLGRLILRESDRMGKILGEFSDFARVDVAQRKPVNVEKLLRNVTETAQRHPAAEARATIDVDVADELTGLWGDPELLHRVVLNLVLNALQVGDPERPVTVRIVADSLRPDLVPSGMALRNPVRIRVIDDGPGIDPQDLPRIFDPFYTRREGGSGLGLSIAHRAVQAHGGTLIATSTPGRGATFIMVLPRRSVLSPPPRFEDRRGELAEAAEEAVRAGAAGAPVGSVGANDTEDESA
jgi:two-component system sensor histidine kinase PilS (NtrC family)